MIVRDRILLKLAEECGELTQQCIVDYLKKPTRQYTELVEELADVSLYIELFLEQDEMKEHLEYFKNRKIKKRKGLENWWLKK